jgi:predicted permease
MNLALPIGMFLNITKDLNRDKFLHEMNGLLVPILSIAIVFFLSKIYAKLTNVPENRRGLFTIMSTASNTIFIGLPVNIAILGNSSIPYVLLYYFVNTTFTWTLGVHGVQRDGLLSSVNTELKQFSLLQTLKNIFNPALVAFLIGTVWMLSEFPVPQFIAQFAGYMNGLMTPLSTFFIGITIYFAGFRNLKINKDVLGVLMFRFIISPVLVWILGHALHLPHEMMLVFFIQSSLPVQTSTPMMAGLYNADTEFPSSTLVVSMLIYIALIPLYLLILFGGLS